MRRQFARHRHQRKTPRDPQRLPSRVRGRHFFNELPDAVGDDVRNFHPVRHNALQPFKPDRTVKASRSILNRQRQRCRGFVPMQRLECAHAGARVHFNIGQPDFLSRIRPLAHTGHECRQRLLASRQEQKPPPLCSPCRPRGPLLALSVSEQVCGLTRLPRVNLTQLIKDQQAVVVQSRQPFQPVGGSAP